MSVPENLKYTKTHEWVMDEGQGKAKIGITEHAQEAMGDLVYIELPEVGDPLTAGGNFAVVESVKATSDVVSPVGGTVGAVNEEIVDAPDKVNEDCYGAWFVELENVQAADLLSPAEYEAFLKEEE